jgi:hypothetical protein
MYVYLYTHKYVCPILLSIFREAEDKMAVLYVRFSVLESLLWGSSGTFNFSSYQSNINKEMKLSFIDSQKGSLYRVIHKSVKHFKNSQQINYASDHDNSYRERISPSFFLNAGPQRPVRVSQSNFATKVDRTHRTRRWRVNAVASPVPRFKPAWLFLLGVCEG